MMYPLVTDLHADGIPVALTCRVLGFSKQAYFKWRKSPVASGTGTTRTGSRLGAHPSMIPAWLRVIVDELAAQEAMRASSRRPGG